MITSSPWSERSDLNSLWEDPQQWQRWISSQWISTHSKTHLSGWYEMLKKMYKHDRKRSFHKKSRFGLNSQNIGGLLSPSKFRLLCVGFFKRYLCTMVSKDIFKRWLSAPNKTHLLAQKGARGAMREKN